MSLFDAAGLSEDVPRPLADHLRPKTLADVVGQDHLVGPEGQLTRLLDQGLLSSLIFWGPPGTGKTTLARLLAQRVNAHYEAISAIFSGVGDLRQIFAAAKARRETGQATLLFVDEIHRFNRSQQDAFLPHMEDGTITLVGATTENPSFALNGALLSRAQVLVVKRLEEAALETLLGRAEAHQKRKLPLTPEARVSVLAMADGDGRHLIGLAEALFGLLPEGAEALSPAELGARLNRRAPLYDRDREEHYMLISALHKSVRASDPDAALYWLERMLAGGEDPLYLARRLVRMAVEDIGLADPTALTLTNSAREAYEHLGAPEGLLALAQATVYLALAPKSNAVYAAQKAATAFVKETGSLPPPNHSLNAPTRLMKELGRGAGYAYDHNAADGLSGQDHFPEGLEKRPVFYRPTDRGLEQALAVRLQDADIQRQALKEGLSARDAPEKP